MRSAYTPIAETVPALRVTRQASSSASGWPTASIAESTPRAVGRLLHRSTRILLGQVNRLGAERARQLEPLLDGVDRDHARGACRLGGLDGAEADRAEPDHGGAVARADARLIDGVPAGAHHVAREQRDVVAHALRDAPQRQVRVRHEHLLGLRALKRAECLAMAEDAPVVALVEVAAAAEEAVAAGRAVAAQHPVALGHLGDRLARRHDRAHELVAEREAGLDHHAAVVDVQVRAAHAGRLDPHHGVVALEQLGLWALLDPHLAGRLEGHGLHQPGTL